MAADPTPCRVCGSPLPARPWGVSGPLGHWWVCGEACANEAKERHFSSGGDSERSVHVYNGEISLTECSVSLTGAELLVLEQLYPEDVS